ncbi:RES family NAD+ phosphorylase [Sphaerotilus sp.]|uniref:RES family NAD+ phosphorylase n=1 Tax=Sphaerotilus sp. TaxID=2093942 RepID=UPI002ACECCF3|nr:RES family NAD+ phosphorylase [Sphaerotilus sp.]MDZ7856324.1 RES family NAD+ phosphorylase [Sphaerotilus sp.]
MKVWRLCRQPFVATALDGIGGLYVSGRWHRRGRPIVYAASSAALAALEVLVHVDPLDAPEDLRLLTLSLPDDLLIEQVEVAALPARWAAVPAPDELAALGTEWLASRRGVALSVPSAVIPMERNLLLNPLHPDVARVRIVGDEAFTFDPRLM